MAVWKLVYTLTHITLAAPIHSCAVDKRTHPKILNLSDSFMKFKFSYCPWVRITYSVVGKLLMTQCGSVFNKVELTSGLLEFTNFNYVIRPLW